MNKHELSISSILMSESSSLLTTEPRSAKKSYQFRALFIKSATLQSKQIGTNVCQILTPIICLIFTLMIQVIARANIRPDEKDFIYPIPLNTPVPQELKNIIGYTCPQWFVYDVPSDPTVQQFVGSKVGVLGQTASGMLGLTNNMSSSCLFNSTDGKVQVLEQVYSPFFRKVNDSSLTQDVANRMNYANQIRLGQNLDYIPDGTVNIHNASAQYLHATLSINDLRTFQYHRQSGYSSILLNYFNDPKFNKSIQFTTAEGQIAFADLLNSAYLKTISNTSSIMTSILFMPPGNNNNVLVDSLVNVAGATIFPLALSLLFPVFLYAIVLEKEERLIQMMKMNGMSMKNYWLVTFLFNLILSIVTNMIFYMVGYFFLDNSFFSQTPFTLMVVILLGWMLAQIGLAVFFQTFLSNSRTANIIGYLISVWTALIGASFNIGVFQLPTEYPYALRMFAPFGFTRIFYLMLSKCSLGECITSWKGVQGELADCILYLYVFFIVFFLLGTYLHEIIPQEYGVTRSPLFPFQMCKRKQTSDDHPVTDPQLADYISQNDQDGDSRAERLKVERFDDDLSQYPLVCNNLRKLYQKEGRTTPFAANKSFNLIIEPKQIFGLLGPNGAGKTTLISLITGMYEPNFGNAWIGGHSIKNQIEKVHLEMGVCPQFDLLWPELTIEEHLCFYARLKGVENVKESVKKAIEQVNLQEFTKFRTTQLSGGMKRRLSVAISLVGSPMIVFLDEPTTGLDPDNRRQLWTIISKCKQERAVFLTTHMMDEADTLCNRIGIITNGVLRTVNNQIKLKRRYGGGYRLDINLFKNQKKLRQSMIEDELQQSNVNHSQEVSRHIENYQQIDDSEFLPQGGQEDQMDHFTDGRKGQLVNFIKANFQDATLVKVFNTNFIFKLGQNVKVSESFELLEKQKQRLGVAQWGIINSSLEDVFMAVVSTFECEDQERQNMAASVLLSKSGDDSHSGSVLVEQTNQRKASNSNTSTFKKDASVLSHV